MEFQLVLNLDLLYLFFYNKNIGVMNMGILLLKGITLDL